MTLLKCPECDCLQYKLIRSTFSTTVTVKCNECNELIAEMHSIDFVHE